MKEVLKQVDHRHTALPKGPWVMKQHWDDLLFLHWPLRKSEMETLIPTSLEVDTFDDFAWVSIVPFQMNHIRFRGIPPIPFCSSLNELNVRTYVIKDGKPGVYFWSLDANHFPAVLMAQTVFHLPYFYAKINLTRTGDQIIFTSYREDARFSVTYEATSAPYFSKEGDLSHWLTERYCLYTTKGNKVYRGDIHHLPWPLQEVTYTIHEEHLSHTHGLHLPKQTPPLAQYCKHLEVYLWPLQKLQES